LIIAVTVPTGSLSESIALLFIAVQTTLSYFVAGISKLVSREWRNGTAIVGIFATEAYGHDWIFRLLERIPSLKLPGAWAVILFETLFPIALLPNDWLLVGMLAITITFHVFNAIFMGLNNFLVAFPATYPAIIYANYYVRELLLNLNGWLFP
jgi:hypothetical protein